MDDEAETYKLWRIRKTVMQVNRLTKSHNELFWCIDIGSIMFTKVIKNKQLSMPCACGHDHSLTRELGEY